MAHVVHQYGGPLAAGDEEPDSGPQEAEQLAAFRGIGPVVVVDRIEGDQRILLCLFLQEGQDVDEDPHRVRVRMVSDHRAVPAVLDFDPEQVAVNHVARDEHVVALPDVDGRVGFGIGHQIAGHHAVFGPDGKETVNGVLVGVVVEDGEPIDAGQMHPVLGEPTYGETADRKPLERCGIAAGAAAGRIFRVVLISGSGGVCRTYPNPIALPGPALENDGAFFRWLSDQRDAPARDGQGIEIALVAFLVGARHDLDAIAGRRAR